MYIHFRWLSAERQRKFSKLTPLEALSCSVLSYSFNTIGFVSLHLLLITVHINASLILNLGGFFCLFLLEDFHCFFIFKICSYCTHSEKIKPIKAAFKNKAITLQLAPANCIVIWLLSFTEGITCQNRFLFSYRPIFISCTVIFLKPLCPHLSELL